MEPRVITLMGDVTVYQATPDLWYVMRYWAVTQKPLFNSFYTYDFIIFSRVKKNVHTETTDKIAKKNANAKMKANVMCPMEAVSVVMVGRVRSVKKGFVRERNYMARSAC